MKYFSLLARIFIWVIIALFLCMMKVNLGLHKHFLLGAGIMLVITIICRLIMKGVDSVGKQ